MKRSIHILLILILASCTPLARAKRKINKAKVLAPELFQKDTIVIRDTVVVPRTVIDTVTSIVYHDSTVVIDNEKVFLRYFFDTTRQEIYHDVECKEQKVIHETIVEVEKIQETSKINKYINFANPMFWIIFILVIWWQWKKTQKDYS